MGDSGDIGEMRAWADEITRAARALDFSGVVSVASLGEEPLDSGPALELAFGFAERGHRVANTVETRFATASGSKAFTAVAIGTLIDAGRIGLETRFADCVPADQLGPLRDALAPGITLGQLLSHTAGVPDYFDEATMSDYAALWRELPCYRMTRPADFLPLIAAQSIQTRPSKAAPESVGPGSGFHYCNAGYVLLALALEALTGIDFPDAVAARVFRPCGMTRSGYFAMDALPEDTATGYVVRDESADGRGWRSNIFAVPKIGGGDGGAFTTAADLRRFWTALLRENLLKPETRASFTSPAVEVPERAATQYGHGFWLREGPRGRVVAIEGADPGVALESQVTLENGRIVTVLSNADDGAREMFERVTALVGRLAGEFEPGGSPRTPAP